MKWNHRSTLVSWLSIVGGTLLCVSALWAAPTQSIAAQVSTTPTTIAWTVPVTQYDRATLVIQGPGTFRVERSFSEGAPLALDLASLSDRSGAAPSYPDGRYKWEVRLFRKTPGSGNSHSETSLAAAEHSAELESAGTMKVKQWVAAGAFRVNQGTIVSIPTRPGRTATGKLAAPAASAGSPRSSASTSGGAGAPVSGRAPEMTPIPEALTAGNFSPDVYIDDSAGSGDTYLDLYEDNAANYFDLQNFNGKFDIDTLNSNLNAGVAPFTIEQNPQDNSLYIASSGAIGIGTSTPETSTMTLAPTADSSDAEVDFEISTYDEIMYLNLGGYFGIGSRASGGCAICINSASQVNDTLSVDGGNVGVGTLSPSSPLHVVGKNGSGVNTTIDGGSLVVTRGDSTPNIRFLKTAGTAQSWLFQNNSTSGVFAIRDETGGTSPVQIFPGAGAKLLQLQGTHVNVNGQIWQRGGVLHADYVFDPGYKLESIAAHAKYMWKHKHLPAIAGVERDADGQEMVNLGAQQRGIVEELEEAHIYIAELNEKEQKLGKELAAAETALGKERQKDKTTQAELARTKAELVARARKQSRAIEALRRQVEELAAKWR